MRFSFLFILFAGLSSAQLQITTASVPVATQYQSYSAALSATGGTPPYTWSVVSSTSVSLPEGMILNPATGVVSAPQVNGQGGYSVTIQVTDSSSPAPRTASANLNFGVHSDAGYGGCQMFPADSIYNQRIDRLPVDSNLSHQIPSSFLSSPLHPDFGVGFYPAPGGIPFLRVTATQPASNVNVQSSGQVEGAGTYLWPFPAWPNATIEGTSYGVNGQDHHILVLQSGPCILYETYNSIYVPNMYNAATNTWTVEGGVHYDLNTNEIAASTSTLDNGANDSAGIPMVPLLIRYSEVPLGVRHPLRISFPGPTNWFVWPGTGCCTGSGPPQGLLYRLKAGVNWQAACPVASNPQAATVLQALQQYGAYMSDHGSAGYVQGVPDDRWSDDDLACIKKLHVSDLEVVDNTALEVSSISGQTKPYVVPAALSAGSVGSAYSATFAEVGGNPAAAQWSVASGSLPPGLVLNAAAGTLSGTISSSAGSPFSFSLAAKDTNSGLSSLPQAFTIAVTGGQSSQTITFAPLSNRSFGTAPFTVSATASSGLPVSINSQTAGVCTVSAATVTLVSAGTCTIQATQSGNASFAAAAPVNQSFQVTPVSQTITFAPLSNRSFGTAPFTVSATASSGLPVSFNSQTAAVCTVSGSTVTLVSAGTCTIQATQSGNANFTAAPAVNQSFQVTTGSQTITFAPLSNRSFGTAPFTVSATASSGLPVSFNSQTAAVCTVSAATVTLVSAGACTIQATQSGNANFTAATAVNQSFQVTTGSQTITFAPLPNQNLGIAPFTVSATASSGLPVSFNSLTAAICTVSGATVTLVSAGTCTIQATQSGNANYAAATPVNQGFLVTSASQTITFNPLPNEPLGTAPFAVTATASSGLPVTFGSLTAAVCSVSGSTVTLLAIGACTVQATQPGDATHSAAVPVSQTFQVTAGVATLSAAALSFPNTIAGTAGAAQTVTLQNTGNAPLTIASITPAGADASSYRYAVDSTRPCPIAPAVLAAGASCTLDVLFAPVSQGAHNNAQMVISDNSGNIAGAAQSISLQGTGIVLSSIVISASSASVAVGATDQFTATGAYSDSSTANLTTQVAWHSGSTGVASIGANGLANALAAGTTNITASLGGVVSNSFALAVTGGTTSAIVVLSGSGQTANVGTAFAAPLKAFVTDSTGKPAPNVPVTFIAPTSGPAGTFLGSYWFFSVRTDASGIATAPAFFANATAGSYTVTAKAAGISPTASFSLTNMNTP